MAEKDSSEAYVFQVNGPGLSETPPVLLLIAQGSAEIMEGHDAYEKILSNFSKVKNSITKKNISEFAPQIVEVMSVRFFSQEAGLEVVEFALFKGNDTSPIGRRYAVKRTGQELTLYSSPSLTAAAGWLAAESKNVLFRGPVTRPMASVPQKKMKPRI